MKFKKTILICSLLLVVAGAFAVKNMPSEAKQVSFQVKAANETVKKGDDVTVDVTVKGDVAMRSVDAYIAYDDSILEFKSASSDAITGSTGLLRVSQLFEEGAYEVSYSITFTALEVGTSSFKVQEMYVEEENNTEITEVDETTAKVTVVNNNAESKDASLESLEVFPETLTPEFASDVYEYSMTVGSDESDIVLSAIPSDSDSVVTITGNEDFQVGENTVVITVTSLSGVEKQYKINVMKEA